MFGSKGILSRISNLENQMGSLNNSNQESSEWILFLLLNMISTIGSPSPEFKLLEDKYHALDKRITLLESRPCRKCEKSI